MAKIVRLSKEGIQIYPQTITDAIADVDSRMVLSDILKLTDARLEYVEMMIGTSGSTSEYLDNLVELLEFFKGVKDDTTFKKILSNYVEGYDVEDNPYTPEDEGQDYPNFDDLITSGYTPVRPEVIPNTPEEQQSEDDILAQFAEGNYRVTLDTPVKNVTIPSGVTGAVSITAPIQDGATITNNSSKPLTINNTNGGRLNIVIINPNAATTLTGGVYDDIYAATKSISGASGQYATITNLTFGEEMQGLSNLSVTAIWDANATVTSYNTNALTIGSANGDEVISNMTVNAPFATVTMNSAYGDVTASVSQDTLILNPSFRATNLHVKSGNAVLKNAKGYADCVSGNVRMDRGTASIYTVDAVQGTNMTSNAGIYNITEDITNKGVTFGVFGNGNFKYNLGHTMTSTNTSSAAFLIRGKVDAEFDGDGIVDSAAYGLWVAAGTHSTVRGGHWIAETHAVYCEEGSVDIYGGEFEVKGEDKTFVINCLDANYRSGKAKITIYGGTYHGFNPADNKAEGEHTSYVADGYKSVEIAEGVWQVVPEN